MVISEPPPAFVLCVRGEKFELGEPLTAAAGSYVEAAFGLLTRLSGQPTLVEWELAALRLRASD